MWKHTRDDGLALDPAITTGLHRGDAISVVTSTFATRDALAFIGTPCTIVADGAHVRVLERATRPDDVRRVGASSCARAARRADIPPAARARHRCHAVRANRDEKKFRHEDRISGWERRISVRRGAPHAFVGDQKLPTVSEPRPGSGTPYGI